MCDSRPNIVSGTAQCRDMIEETQSGPVVIATAHVEGFVMVANFMFERGDGSYDMVIEPAVPVPEIERAVQTVMCGDLRQPERVIFAVVNIETQHDERRIRRARVLHEFLDGENLHLLYAAAERFKCGKREIQRHRSLDAFPYAQPVQVAGSRDTFGVTEERD